MKDNGESPSLLPLRLLGLGPTGVGLHRYLSTHCLSFLGWSGTLIVRHFQLALNVAERASGVRSKASGLGEKVVFPASSLQSWR